MKLNLMIFGIAYVLGVGTVLLVGHHSSDGTADGVHSEPSVPSPSVAGNGDERVFHSMEADPFQIASGKTSIQKEAPAPSAPVPAFTYVSGAPVFPDQDDDGLGASTVKFAETFVRQYQAGYGTNPMQGPMWLFHGEHGILLNDLDVIDYSADLN